MMNKLEKTISDLSSSNKNTRSEACEELRVADSLPESTITALEAATQDPDPLVADAARRALAIHKHPQSTEESPSTSQESLIQEIQEEPRKWNPLAIASFILSILVYVLWFFLPGILFAALALQASDISAYSLIELLFGAVQFISSLAAIVIGAVAIFQIKRSGGRQKGIGFAIAGIAFQAIIYIFLVFVWWYVNYVP